MRPALLCLLLVALSWPALAQQDQSQTAPAQSPTTATPPATTPPPPAQAPAQPSTPAGALTAPKTEAPPSSRKTTKATRKNTSKKRKTSKKKQAAKHKKAAPEKLAETNAEAGPKRIVVRSGGTSDTGGQLEPGVPVSQADHQRQATEQLLQATDANLKKVAQRKLTPDQQDMVRQITSYMQQSRSASEEGDLGRARNLAVKASQLCDALTRQ